jgi:hypothetical protein
MREVGWYLSIAMFFAVVVLSWNTAFSPWNNMLHLKPSTPTTGSGLWVPHHRPTKFLGKTIKIWHGSTFYPLVYSLIPRHSIAPVFYTIFIWIMAPVIYRVWAGKSICIKWKKNTPKVESMSAYRIIKNKISLNFKTTTNFKYAFKLITSILNCTRQPCSQRTFSESVVPPFSRSSKYHDKMRLLSISPITDDYD